MLSICCNREMLEEDTYLSAAKTFFLLIISYKGKGGGGIWAVFVFAFDRGSRLQDMESFKVSFSSLKMESQRVGRHKKKRERQDGGNIWRNKTRAKPCDNMKGLESLLREA